MQRGILPLALACGLFFSSTAKAEDSPATVRWELPWQKAPELNYETELRTVGTKGALRQADVMYSTDTVRTVETPDGYKQTWEGRDIDYRVTDGDRSSETLQRDGLRSLEDLKSIVLLDKEGRYTGIENLDEVLSRAAVVTRPVVTSAMEAANAKRGAEALDRASLEKLIETVLAQLSDPEEAEPLLSWNLQLFNDFAGGDFVPGQAYERTSEMPASDGGAPDTLRLTYWLETPEQLPEDYFVSFERVIEVSGDRIHDAGHFLAHRVTGVIEMFQATRTTKSGDSEKVQRQRMRLVNAEHRHYWKDDPALDVEHEASAS